MRHLAAKHSDPNIVKIDLSALTVLTRHKDERWKTRDLFRIQNDGMLYPITVWKMTVDEYERQRRYHTLPEPTVVDGAVYGVKFGNNRVQVAQHLGYDLIDARIFEDHREAVMYGMQFREW